MPDKPVTWSWKGQIDDSHSDGVISSLSVGCWTGYVEGSTMQSVHEECVDSAKKWFISQCGSKDIPNTFEVWRSVSSLRFTNDIFGSFGSFGRGSVLAGYPVEANFPAQSSVYSMYSMYSMTMGSCTGTLSKADNGSNPQTPWWRTRNGKPREASKESNPKDIRQCQKQESKIIQIQRREMASSEFGQGLVAVASFPRNILYSKISKEYVGSQVLHFTVDIPWRCARNVFWESSETGVNNDQLWD